MALALASGPKDKPCSSTHRAGQSQALLLTPRAAVRTATQTQQHRLGQQDRHSPCLLASKFSYALGNRSRLDPVCSRRNSPKMEMRSQRGRAMKGREKSSQEAQAGAWRQPCCSVASLLASGQTSSCRTPAPALRPLRELF